MSIVLNSAINQTLLDACSSSDKAKQSDCATSGCVKCTIFFLGLSRRCSKYRPARWLECCGHQLFVSVEWILEALSLMTVSGPENFTFQRAFGSPSSNFSARSVKSDSRFSQSSILSICALSLRRFIVNFTWPLNLYRLFGAKA